MKCPLCPEQFHLNYIEDEWNRVNTMIKAAEKAIRETIRGRHEDIDITFNWNPTVPYNGRTGVKALWSEGTYVEVLVAGPISVCLVRN